MSKVKINKNLILENAFKEINKKTPDTVCGKYKSIGENVDVQVISTGSLAVDAAIGGGFAKNRLINLLGHTSSGKTTLALTAIANLQKTEPDPEIVFLDAEHALDPSYAADLGVNIDELIIIQPESGEAGITAAEILIETGTIDLLVIDSIASLLPKSIIDRSYDSEAQPGQFAKFISIVVARLNRLAKLHSCTVILINQYKPVVKMNQFAAVPGQLPGTNWYQPGGAQLPFYCSQIIEIKKSSEIKTGKEVTSNVITMTCKKNKIAPPYKTAEFVITYGKGLDKVQELIGLGLSYGFIGVQGSFYNLSAVDPSILKPIQGRAKLASFIEENKDFANKLEELIKSEIGKSKKIEIAKNVEDEEFVDDPDIEEIDKEMDVMDMDLNINNEIDSDNKDSIEEPIEDIGLE